MVTLQYNNPRHTLSNGASNSTGVVPHTAVQSYTSGTTVTESAHKVDELNTRITAENNSPDCIVPQTVAAVPVNVSTSTISEHGKMKTLDVKAVIPSEIEQNSRPINFEILTSKNQKIKPVDVTDVGATEKFSCASDQVAAHVLMEKNDCTRVERDRTAAMDAGNRVETTTGDVASESMQVTADTASIVAADRCSLVVADETLSKNDSSNSRPT